MHSSEGRAGLTAIPLTFIDKLVLDLSHSGACLRLRCLAIHHARYVQVFNHQVLILCSQTRGHLVLRVASQARDAPVEPVLTPLRFSQPRLPVALRDCALYQRISLRSVK